MAVVFKKRVRREIPDEDLSKWEADGWHLAGAAPVENSQPKPSKPSLKVVMEEEPESEDDPEDSSVEPVEEE
jgi:hypothetical protein